jgi:hypothetical protein
MLSNIFGRNLWSADPQRIGASFPERPPRSSRSDYAPGGRYGGLPLPRRSGQFVDSYGTGRGGGGSRLGRLRQQPSIFLRDLDSRPPRFIDDQRDRYPSREHWMGQYDPYEDDIGPDRSSHPTRSRLNELAAYLGQSHSLPLPYEPRLLLENALHNPDPHFDDSRGIPDLDAGYPASEYSLDHFGRQGRPYRYRSPYVEDYESILSEVLNGEGDEDELRSLLGSAMGTDRGLMYPVRGLLQSRDGSRTS